jgi:cysteine desulfurase
MKKSTYLDHAAATPMDPGVFKAMKPYITDKFANPSSPYAAGREASEALEAARKRISTVLGAKPLEIIFTSGSTEAANLAIMGVAAKFPYSRIVVSSIEHEAVLDCMAALERQGRLTGVLPVVSNGIMDPESVVAGVDDTTALVCVMYANNEIGTIQPLVKISQQIAQIRASRKERGITLPLYLYTDAAQAGDLNLQVNRLGVDMMSLGGSKIYGPKSSGFLYVRTGVDIEPLIYGGGQERGLRSGTQNVAAALGLATALELMQKTKDKEVKRQSALRDYLIGEIIKKIEGTRLNGDRKLRLASNINITIPGVSGESLVLYLDKAGYQVATGSACTAANEDPSHVLLALGLTKHQAESSLRITLGRSTTKQDLVGLVRALAAAVARLRELSGASKVK